MTLSMMRSRNFAKDYGVLMVDGPLAGITGRAVVVLDASNKVVYTQLVPEITVEPAGLRRGDQGAGLTSGALAEKPRQRLCDRRRVVDGSLFGHAVNTSL